MALLPFLAAFAAAAEVIDRRSFPLVSCPYVDALANAVAGDDGTRAALMAIGAALPALRSFWTQARIRLVSVLPA